MEHSDKQCLDRYRAGDVGALGEMVEHYRRPLFGFIIKMTEGRDEADEIFQEVWIRAIRNMDRYRDKSFLSWLFRIAHNLIIDRARKRKPETSFQAETEGLPPLDERIPSPTLSPSDLAQDDDLKIRIAEAVKQLPDEQRAVFLMRMEHDLPFKDIARIQGTSINTALARMQYALRKLRNGLAVDYATLSR